MAGYRRVVAHSQSALSRWRYTFTLKPCRHFRQGGSCSSVATCSALTINFRGGRNGVLSKIDCYSRPCWPIDTKLSEMIVHMSLVITPGITQMWPKDVLCPFLSWLPRRFMPFLIRSPSNILVGKQFKMWLDCDQRHKNWRSYWDRCQLK